MKYTRINNNNQTCEFGGPGPVGRAPGPGPEPWTRAGTRAQDPGPGPGLCFLILCVCVLFKGGFSYFVWPRGKGLFFLTAAFSYLVGWVYIYIYIQLGFYIPMF